MQNRKVKKAVITAAGLGTRFLPATKNIPKEMLPIVDLPIIHYIAEECVEAGIEDIIVVIRPGNEAAMTYFSPSNELDRTLAATGKEKQLERYYKVAGKANFIFVHQNASLPYGNGSPVLTAKNLVGNEPFVVCFGDDLVLNPNGHGAVKQMTDAYEAHQDAYGVMAVTKVPREEISRYGIVETVDGCSDGKIKRIVEKPQPEEVNSNMADFGRMVLAPEIFEYLRVDNTGKDGELWLVDAIEQMLASKPVYAKEIEGEFLTTGDPLRFLKASYKFAMQRPEIAGELKKFLEEEVLSKKTP
ncbi:MAG TPA: UTP--glucose-1-phosphate uridylyltransferase [Spirochaetia bacterium]|nr:UTP--glucose-1-phosphate uridylyltransferase [Spirochaetia bacterium]